MIIRRALRRIHQALGHVGAERIAPLGAVHGDGEQALVEVLQDDFVCTHVFWLSLLLVDLSSVIARSEATKQSMLSLRLSGLLRSLAMTNAYAILFYFFTSGQRDCSIGWNASLPGTVASSL